MLVFGSSATRPGGGEMTKWFNSVRRCQYRYCGKVIPPGKNGNRHYCSKAHKQAEYRLRTAEFENWLKEYEKENPSPF